jgi:hypothetical protein
MREKGAKQQNTNKQTNKQTNNGGDEIANSNITN